MVPCFSNYILMCYDGLLIPGGGGTRYIKKGRDARREF